MKLHSYSHMKYEGVAPLFGLYSFAQASDIQPLDIHRSRLPVNKFREVMKNLRIADCHVGGVSEHENEAARCSYLNALFGSIASFFQKRIINRPEYKLVGGVASQGQVKYSCLIHIIYIYFRSFPQDILNSYHQHHHFFFITHKPMQQKLFDCVVSCFLNLLNQNLF